MELGAALSPEQLDELCAEDSFKEALGRWLADGAVIWNTWQKGLPLYEEAAGSVRAS